MSLFNISRQELEWAGKKLILETGKIARQATGAVMVTYGETKVLCTVVVSPAAKPDIDFFPLSVHYLEKAYAVGKIPGGFIKRETKPSEQEVLTSRLIDRPIRPLFPEAFRNEVQVICTTLSHDLENASDIPALIGASAALAISGIPFLGPIAGARVGYINGQYVLNPTLAEIKQSSLDLVVAGTDEGVLMVESEAQELSEEVMLKAVEFGHKSFQCVIEAINKLKAKAGKAAFVYTSIEDITEKFFKQIKKTAQKGLEKAYSLADKQERYKAIDDIYASVKEKIEITDGHDVAFKDAFEKLKAEIMRGKILKDGLRVDGRDSKTIRPIEVEVGILPRAHGSALFTRGETQALVVTTLGTGQDEQIMDLIQGEIRENFMLQYNFLPFSTGETGRMSAPGRREIGHGRLAWRSLHPMMPGKEKFPYTVRTVSEITESNGSSSMATVCGTSLALMDAGVPLPRPVAGIAMGLIKEGKKYVVLSDILGDEDHLGDMDFKVAGTELGITALQMDIKITSITHQIMEGALEQAREGRLHILGIMAGAIVGSRASVSQMAPKMASITIAKERIRDLIGPGGKVIRELCETTQSKIDINEDGTVHISAMTEANLEAAKKAVAEIAGDPNIGDIFIGKVVRLADFGAFVNFLGNRDGLVHISEIANERINRVSDVLKVGDEVKVKVLGIDDRGKVKLTMKI